MRCWIFVLLFFIPASFIHANAFTFYSVNEGLAQSTVNAIYKDPAGPLWIATGDGLSIFNGHTFRNFYHRYNDPQGLSSNTVRRILPDKLHHCVWIGTESGVDCFDEAGTKIIDRIGFPEFRTNENHPLFADDSSLWIFVSGRGIYKVEIKTHRYARVHSDQVYFFCEMLPGTDILFYQDSKHRPVQFHLESNKAEILNFPEDLIFSGVLACDGGFLFSSDHGLWKSDKSGRNFFPARSVSALVDPSKDNFKCMAKDSSGRYWMYVIGKGLYSADAGFKEFRLHGWQQTGENISAKLTEVRKIYCDAWNVLWLGTDGEGLVRYNGNRLFFGDSFTETPVIDSAKWFVRAICPDGNITWIGTFCNGLKKINYLTGEIRSYTSPLFKIIYCLAKSRDGVLLAGTENGLYEFSGEKFFPYTISPKLKVTSIFQNFLHLRDGRIVVASNHAMLLVDEKIKTVIPFDDSFANYSGIAELEDGRILCAATYSGFYFFSQDLQKTGKISFESLGLPEATTVIDFAPDGNSGWWAASSIGILHFSKDFKLAEIITDKNGLPSNMIYGIQKLPTGILVLSTGNGVSFFDPQTKSWRNFTITDGLRSNECNTRTLVFSPGQYLYIGSINGFVRKKFPFEEQPEYNPVCFAENFLVNDSLWNNRSSLSSLSYLQNSISFNLSSSDFAFSETGSWMYHLDGLDSHYVTIPANVPISLSSLLPGSYTLRVFIPGNTVKEIYSVSFTILPPWWRTTWFKIAAAFFLLLVLSGILYLAFNYRYRKKLQKLEALRAIEKIRTRISGDIHDDLGAGLTKIALTSDLVSTELRANEQASKKIGQMAETARTLSQSLKEVVWSVKPEHDNLESTIRYFKSYCGEFFEDTPVHLSFGVNIPAETIPVSPENRRNLFLILKEALNNVLKHSDAKKVHIEIRFENNWFEMSVADDGKGFDAARISGMINSNGLQNIKKRAKLTGMKLEIDSAEGAGVKLVIKGVFH